MEQIEYCFFYLFQSIVLANPEPEADPEPAADPHALFFGSSSNRGSSHKGSTGTIRTLKCKCRRRKLPKCTKYEDSGEEDGEYESENGGCSGPSCIPPAQVVPIPFPIPASSGGNS